MPRSLANGDYSLVVAVESASHANSWYRVLADRRTGNLSCDCPPWTFNQGGGSVRACKHTRVAHLLATAQAHQRDRDGLSSPEPEEHPLISVTRQQWPGLGGQWSIEQRRISVENIPYLFVLLRLATGNGGVATGLVAFAERYHPTVESMVAPVAGWAGYSIAAEVARTAGYPMAGQPPEHFRVTRPTRTTPSGQAERRIGLSDILRVGDQVDLGDGLRPAQRAENTLQLFLGAELYQQLERQHFLDVSSVRYAHEHRVYRLRRDPARQRDRRVRVFQENRYINDYCIVRAQDVPEADHLLTVFLRLLSDEEGALSVVKNYNIFPPYSDGGERETVPVTWQQRVA